MKKASQLSIIVILSICIITGAIISIASNTQKVACVFSDKQ